MEENMYIEHPLIRPGSILKREYQLEICKRLEHGKNTLVVLPTGTGKTVIALLYIANLLSENNDINIIFVAPTRPLVKQHYEYLKNHLLINPLNIGLVTGEYQPNIRKHIWVKKIIITTPQTLYNDLLREYINPKNINVIIFDEAHHAVGNHPYVKIARYLNQISKPQIIGLTASPGNRDKISEIMRNLYLDDLIILTRNDIELRRYLPPVNFFLIKTEVNEIYRHALNLIYEAIDNRIIAIRELLSDYKEDIPFNNWRDLTYSRLIELKENVESIYSKNKISDSIRKNTKNLILELVVLDKLATYLETYGFHPFIKYFDEILKRAAYKRRVIEKKIANDIKLNELYILIREMIDKNIIYPKFLALEKILSEVNRGKVMVFVGLRELAFNLRDFFSSKGYSCGVLVGQQRRGGMSQQKQLLELGKFRDGVYNILIATQVGEEGLDITECQTVIFYDNPISSIRRIQRSGRTGRTMPGRIYFLVTPGTRDEIKFWAGVKKERKILEDLKVESYKIKKVGEGMNKWETLEYYMTPIGGEGKLARSFKEKNNGGS